MTEIEIPDRVIDGLMKVRESAVTSMGNQQAVIDWLDNHGWYGAVEWLKANPDEYMNALNEMGQRSPAPNVMKPDQMKKPDAGSYAQLIKDMKRFRETRPPPPPLPPRKTPEKKKGKK